MNVILFKTAILISALSLVDVKYECLIMESNNIFNFALF